MSGWRPALLIAWRDALRHKGRSALVLVMISLPVLAVSAAAVIIKTSEVTGIEGADRTLGAADARVRTEGRGRVVQSADPMGGQWMQLGDFDYERPARRGRRPRRAGRRRPARADRHRLAARAPGEQGHQLLHDRCRPVRPDRRGTLRGRVRSPARGDRRGRRQRRHAGQGLRRRRRAGRRRLDADDRRRRPRRDGARPPGRARLDGRPARRLDQRSRVARRRRACGVVDGPAAQRGRRSRHLARRPGGPARPGLDGRADGLRHRHRRDGRRCRAHHRDGPDRGRAPRRTGVRGRCPPARPLRSRSSPLPEARRVSRGV